MTPYTYLTLYSSDYTVFFYLLIQNLGSLSEAEVGSEAKGGSAAFQQAL